MTILEAILAVFTAIGGWIGESITLIMPIFYTVESGLTLIGVCSVAGLGFSVVFLLLGLMQSFLHFRR